MKLRLIGEDEFDDLDDADEFGTFKLDVDQYIDTPIDWSNKPYPSKNCFFKDLFNFGEVWVKGRLIIGDIVIAKAYNRSLGGASTIIVNDKLLEDFSVDELEWLANELDMIDNHDLYEKIRFEILWEFVERED